MATRIDTSRVQKMLDRAQRQIPFATSQALNDVAFKSRKALRAQAINRLDRPTPFTLGGFQFKKASKRNLQAVVFVEGKRAPYLKYQIEGGTRIGSGKGTGVPTQNKNLNKYGNIPGRKSGLVKGKREFIDTIKGVSGVWRRTGGKRNPGLKLMVGFEKSVNYSPRLPFYRIVEGVFKSQFAKLWQKRFRAALRTAR